ncbi:16S rRNA (guanine(1207)-N(2))-methyltransferase RsmC [Martelella alba]|uniref:16S rRNA (Guanine(1207)-N(2))-methyltransferase RsmC n=1 Tax=Martelella alba TaxID=2590451 RepID=A0ABY2SQY3_9HYPH|nr:16S rRNA (guanine(1207)-N(2))-methyltransferase RsmC [Martelella alba]TKI08624.1 16S rRNA (guanine(1207)-N(2))-methyltransferase RsmC [Martelella alba]
MSVFTPASEVLLRHEDIFTGKQVLFAGDIQDALPAETAAGRARAHTAWYHRYRALQAQMGGENVRFGLIAEPEFVQPNDTLVYYWPKNKPEARFQLFNLLSLLPTGADVFVVGENRSGVRGAEALLAEYCPLAKIDGARRCGLYHGRLVAAPRFEREDFRGRYTLEGVTVETLPGVFSRDALDNGSQLLLSTFTEPVAGALADIGCGAGVLAAILAKRFPGLDLTLSDVHAPALAASRATLAANGLDGAVLASDAYSDLPGLFDVIISNPPFHEGRQTDLQTAEKLIRGARTHLCPGGQLRIVANAFLPYPAILDAEFGSHAVLAQTGRFKVYQAINTPPRRKNRPGK